MNELKVSAAEWKSWKGASQTLVAFAFEDEFPLGIDGKAIAPVAQADGFKASLRDSAIVRPTQGVPAERVVLVGLGKKNDYTSDVARQALSGALRAGEKLGLPTLYVRIGGFRKSKATPEELQAAAEGLFLGSYRFTRHQTPAADASKKVSEVVLLVDGTADARKAIDRARIYSAATMVARDLINEPPSRMNPDQLAAEAKKLSSKGLTVKVHEIESLRSLGMGGILGVGMGGAVPPRFVEILYKPSQKAKKSVAVVGKGITFDSGGLSLKPAQSMETMKDDMSGAAAVIGIMSAVADLKPRLEVRGYLAIAENMPGGRAQKPGDVLKAYNGKTIEVLNTDAEGRLVLSDALSYASAQNPDIMIDIATLTGAAVVALGHLVSGIMTNEPRLAKALIQSGEKAGEKFWELPLVKEYQKDIKSKIADVKNIGGRRGEAGTIIGGLFLQEFVTVTPWAHIDIAGPSWTDSDTALCPTGGTGHPVRTILHYLESLN